MRTILDWKCGDCDSVQKSDSSKRWSMDYCKCGKSFVDLEEHYQRNMGEVIVINTSVFGEINDIHQKNVHKAVENNSLSDEELIAWIKAYNTFQDYNDKCKCRPNCTC